MKVSQSLYKLAYSQGTKQQQQAAQAAFFYLTGKILPKCEIENEVIVGSFDQSEVRNKEINIIKFR
jgi:hypothetical protein